ncbi:GDP-mannose 4,6-dehydratase, partial [Hyphomicrobium sp.]|uniref:GDP-mannose 4,6-dehydratase n=1 Tax=Hyphomicrobium sp. TaxID=82 RepID=UPI0025BE2603
EEFVAAAFGVVGIDWRDHVDFDPSLRRPSEIVHSLGDARRARERLGWGPTVGFEEIVERMIRGEREGAAT